MRLFANQSADLTRQVWCGSLALDEAEIGEPNCTLLPESGHFQAVLSSKIVYHTPVSDEFLPTAGGFGARIEWYASVPSTMPLAHALAARTDVHSGAAVLADEQTAGKGRMGRRWESPPARGLMVSFMLRRAEHPVPLNRLGMVTALGALEACRSVGLSAARLRCKWPNDVIVLHGDKQPGKVAGILIETSMGQSEWTHAVLGIGINVNQRSDELPAVHATAFAPTSLRLALGEEGDAQTGSAPPLDRGRLFAALCSGLNRAAALPAETILAEWQSALWTPTEKTALWQGERLLATGDFAGTDDDGQLLLRMADGEVSTWSAADLSLRLA